MAGITAPNDRNVITTSAVDITIVGTIAGTSPGIVMKSAATIGPVMHRDAGRNGVTTTASGSAAEGRGLYRAGVPAGGRGPGDPRGQEPCFWR